MCRKEEEKGKTTQDEMGICVYFSLNQSGGAKPSLLNWNDQTEKCLLFESNKYNLYEGLGLGEITKTVHIISRFNLVWRTQQLILCGDTYMIEIN